MGDVEKGKEPPHSEIRSELLASSKARVPTQSTTASSHPHFPAANLQFSRNLIRNPMKGYVPSGFWLYLIGL